MLTAKVTDHSLDLEAKGELHDLVRDCMIIIGDVYSCILRGDSSNAKELAEEFQYFVQKFAMDDEFWRTSEDISLDKIDTLTDTNGGINKK